MTSRETIFISHGNPEDNLFAGWLAARLKAGGYRVWIDLWHDKGHPTWEEIETEIRQSARRLIALVSTAGVVKPGFKDEINAAVGVARDLDDPGFILPIRLNAISFRTEVPIQLARLNFIDGHNRGWDEVLADIIEQLQRDQIPAAAIPSAGLIETWLARHRAISSLVSRNPERVLTNWFRVASFPREVNFYTSGSSHAAWEAAASSIKLPKRYHEGVLCTFASAADVRMSLPLGVRVKTLRGLHIEEFLDGSSAAPAFSVRADARRVMVDIIRQGFGDAAAARGFRSHNLANRVCWYPKLSTVGDGRVGFDCDGFTGSRQLLGRHKDFFWHYAVSVDVLWSPTRIVGSGHVVFSLDGENILSQSKLAACLRRQAVKSKRNAWWRDVMLAYFAKLAGEASEIALPVGSEASVCIERWPISLQSPLRLDFDSDVDESPDGPIPDAAEEVSDDDDLAEGEDEDDTEA
jgi:hypothetical protein